MPSLSVSVVARVVKKIDFFEDRSFAGKRSILILISILVTIVIGSSFALNILR